VPLLTIFAGPNGSGKSSLIRQVEFEGRTNLLEPDAIARRIKPAAPQKAGLSAGREVLRRTAEYIRNAESFAIETTLAGGWTNSAIGAALERSFFIRLFYISSTTPNGASNECGSVSLKADTTCLTRMSAVDTRVVLRMPAMFCSQCTRPSSSITRALSRDRFSRCAAGG